MEPKRNPEPPVGSRGERARRLRDRFTWLNRFSDEELEQLSFCKGGAELVPGQTYFDLSHPENGPFTGAVDQLIPEDGCVICQRDVSARLWDKLTRYP